MNKPKLKSAGSRPCLPLPLKFAATLAIISIPHVGHAQGIFRGAQQGSYEGGRIAGPVGGVVGGAVGAGVGGAVGAVQGVFGVPHYYRHQHHCRSGRYHCYR